TNLVTITGGNDLTLDVIGTVTQTAAISASGLQLLGAGAVNLDNNANDVATIAANHSGTISYHDANALSVGTVTDSAQPTAAITTISGITHSADVSLPTRRNPALTNLVPITGGNDLTLEVTGTLTQTAAISATGLQLLGAGAVNLNNNTN